MNNFYITLPSFEKSKYFDNNLAKFRTKLASRVKLYGNWEVGVSSISYTYSNFNINEKEYIEFVYYDWFNITAKKFSKQIEISTKNYDDIKKLLQEIEISREKVLKNLQLNDTNVDLPKFELVDKYNMIRCNLPTYNNFLVYPQMSDHLCKILGFDKASLDDKMYYTHEAYHNALKSKSEAQRKIFKPSHVAKDKVIWAKNEYELKADFNSLFVYSNIVKDSYIGENLRPLLRFVEIPCKAKFGDQIVFNFPEILLYSIELQ